VSLALTFGRFAAVFLCDFLKLLFLLLDFFGGQIPQFPFLFYTDPAVLLN
jgi:hypothetical protein